MSKLVIIHVFIILFRITSILHKHLDNYKPVGVVEITQALIFTFFKVRAFCETQNYYLGKIKIDVFKSFIV